MTRSSLIVAMLVMMLLKLDFASSSLGVKTGPEHIGSWCTRDDLTVHQAATPPLPNGIPTYTVHIVNQCMQEGCSISKVHVSCGWYSSARLVNPKVFRRVKHNDCLVNDGRKVVNGAVIAFQYANTFKYPMAVTTANVTCI